MGIQAGLVGLPNVGKSTLFNALTKSQVPAANYPFCTIDPHMAVTPVPDPRAEKLQKLYNSEKIIPATVTFVDIAGLVKGAASGEGLGNQFLSHIREVDLILHVLRCFEDPNITHTSADINPLEDFEIIVSELMLKDLESVQKRIAKLEKDLKISSLQAAEKKEMTAEQQLLTKVFAALNEGKAEIVRSLIAEAPVKTIPLLSAKKFLVIANIAEGELETYQQNKYYQMVVQKFGQDIVIPVCAKVEHELSQLTDEEADEMMGMLGLHERSLHVIIKKTYDHLDLITFFTCGPKEIHAWPIKKGITIRAAAGEIHSDLERGFIKGEVFNCNDLFTAGSINKLKEAGKMRTEGQDYIVEDGDIILVRFNV